MYPDERRAREQKERDMGITRSGAPRSSSLSSSDLSDSEIAALRDAIDGGGTTTPKGVRNALGLRNGAEEHTRSVLEGLESQGLVRKSNSGSRYYNVTPAGRNALDS